MRTANHSNPGFQNQLSNCSGADNVRNLLKRNSAVHTRLLKQSCSNCPLQLKGKTLLVWEAMLDDEVDSFFKRLELDNELKASDKKPHLLIYRTDQNFPNI